MTLAPVIVFAYNRPEHLQKTLDALAKNELAKESTLYIYCDGAKPDASEEQLARVQKVREVAQSAKGFKDIHINCAEANKGLANSVIGGVTEVIDQWGKVIVVEDDLLTSPYFLNYMNEGLNFYEHRPAVYSIGGYNFPPQKMVIPEDYEYDTYVSLRFCSWGWATWKDRWLQINWSSQYFENHFKNRSQIEAFNRGGDDLSSMLYMQGKRMIDSWAIRFAYNQFVNHGVTILPCKSYVDNIGCDGSGVHCGDLHDTLHNDVNIALANPRMPEVIYEDRRIINAFANYYSKAKRPLWQKVINTIYRKFSKPVPFVIKKKIYC